LTPGWFGFCNVDAAFFSRSRCTHLFHNNFSSLSFAYLPQPSLQYIRTIQRVSPETHELISLPTLFFSFPFCPRLQCLPRPKAPLPAGSQKKSGYPRPFLQRRIPVPFLPLIYHFSVPSYLPCSPLSLACQTVQSQKTTVP